MSTVIDIPIPRGAQTADTADLSLREDAELTKADVEKLSRGQPWIEANVIREILFHADCHVYAGLEMGRLLLWSKTILRRGEFDSWIANNFKLKRRSAYNYMQLARYALAHPSMAEPMARMGLRNALEMARLPDAITEDICSGRLPELEPTELETLTYPDLKKRLAKIEKERAELADQVEGYKRRTKELEEEEEEEAVAQGRLTRGAQKKVIKKIDDLRDEFDKLMAEIGQTLDTAANRCATGELDVSVRLRVRGFAAYISAYADIENARFRTISGDDVTGEEQNEPWNRSRPMSDHYELPAGRVLPFMGEGQ